VAEKEEQGVVRGRMMIRKPPTPAGQGEVNEEWVCSSEVAYVAAGEPTIQSLGFVVEGVSLRRPSLVVSG
jgi:hypothetical protein